jgi:hypothetical protein
VELGSAEAFWLMGLPAGIAAHRADEVDPVRLGADDPLARHVREVDEVVVGNRPRRSSVWCTISTISTSCVVASVVCTSVTSSGPATSQVSVSCTL